MEEYGSDDDDENTIMHSPAEAATSRLDLDDSRLSEINSSTGEDSSILGSSLD